MNNYQAKDLVFIPAGNTKQMSEWGNEMGNCIGSYTQEALSGRGIYCGVTRNDKLIANLEIDAIDNKLKQLLGKYNRILDDITCRQIVDVLKLHAVDCDNDWWGRE